MKIAIGINSFKIEKDLNNREKMCVESLHKVAKLFPNNVELINLSFKDEPYATLHGFKNLHCLNQIPTNITNKKIPFVNEIFDNLSALEADYFLFINNDIIISDRYIKTILSNTTYDCFPASKLHFIKLDSLQDKKSIPESLSVHGFDGFAIKSSWWKENKDKFKSMLLSRAYWDTYFYSKCHLYGKSLTLNKPPAVIFHLDHKSTSMEEDSGNIYNEKIFVEDPDHLSQRWFPYVQNVLLKRPAKNNIKWYVPFDEEQDIEKKYFIL
jgi:hypothetical protein